MKSSTNKSPNHKSKSSLRSSLSLFKITFQHVPPGNIRTEPHLTSQCRRPVWVLQGVLVPEPLLFKEAGTVRDVCSVSPGVMTWAPHGAERTFRCSRSVCLRVDLRLRNHLLDPLFDPVDHTVTHKHTSMKTSTCRQVVLRRSDRNIYHTWAEEACCPSCPLALVPPSQRSPEALQLKQTNLLLIVWSESLKLRLNLIFRSQILTWCRRCHRCCWFRCCCWCCWCRCCRLHLRRNKHTRSHYGCRRYWGCNTCWSQETTRINNSSSLKDKNVSLNSTTH